MAKYQIFTDSCSDLSTELRKENNIDYVHMGLVVNDEEKVADLDWIDYKPEEFYGWLSSGKKIKTTQVSIEEFVNKFRPYLEKGIDIMYLACSSALSGSINVFHMVVEELKKEFPDRKFVGIDTLCGSFTEGLLVLYAARKQKEGLSIDELAQWVEDNKFYFNQFATVDTLKYLKDAGRIKGAAAFFGNVIGIKPIFISDRKGNNLVVKKVKGTKASLDELFEGIKNTLDKEKCDEVFVGQGMAMERAELLKNRIESELNIKATIIWIGPIVGTTCGPGVIGTFCYGKEVTRFEGDGVNQ